MDLEAERDRQAYLRALPPFNHIPAKKEDVKGTHGFKFFTNNAQKLNPFNDAENQQGPSKKERPEKARQLSMRRIIKDKVRLVDTHSGFNTPVHNNSATNPIEHDDSTMPPFPNVAVKSEDARPGTGRARSGTDESLIAVLQTHTMTMRTLRTLSPSASLWRARKSPKSPKFPYFKSSKSSKSLTQNRHISIAPVSISRSQSRANDPHCHPNAQPSPKKNVATYLEDASSPDLCADPNHPAHLPSHFVRTPYPFTPNKVFPKPLGRTHASSIDDAIAPVVPYIHIDALKAKQIFGLALSPNDQWSLKGKQALGLVDNNGHFTVGARRAKFVGRAGKKVG